MTRTITTAAELDALPEKSVLLDAGGWPVWRDPRFGWCASNGVRGIPSDLVVADGGPLTLVHDPSAPAPDPSVMSEAAVEAAARVMASLNEGIPQYDLTEYEVASWRDSTRAALTAALPHLTAAPSATRDEVARALCPDVWRIRDDGPFPAGSPPAEAVVRGSRETADALLARFNITPKEGR